MDIEEVQQTPIRQKNIGAKAAPRFQLSAREIVIFRVLNWEPGQSGVSIIPFFQGAISPKDYVVFTQSSSNELCLISHWRARPPHYLLQSDTVGVQFSQHLCDSQRRNAAIESAALVDVIGDNAQRRSHASDHLKPLLPTAGVAGPIPRSQRNAPTMNGA